MPISLPLRANAAAIDSALAVVNRLLDEGVHRAAAMLYAFASRPRCFPLAWHAMTALLAKNGATAEGFRLVFETQEFASVVARIASREITHDDVDAWVRDRLVPL